MSCRVQFSDLICVWFCLVSGEAETQKEAATKSSLPVVDGEESGRKKETMELFPQSAGLGGVQDAATPDAIARY